MPQKNLAFFSQTNNKLIEILPYTYVTNHTNFWKLELTNEQRDVLVSNWITKNVFLKLTELQALDNYFDASPKVGNLDLSSHKETIFDYVTYVEKAVKEE